MSYTAEELKDLVKICSKSRVKELKLGELHVIFDTIEPKLETTISQPPIHVPEYVVEKAEKLASSQLFKQETETRDEQLSRMILEQPSVFEDLLAMGDLEDGGEKAQDH